MSLVELLVNLLLAFGTFFAVRWLGSMIAPEGQDRDKLVTVVAVIIAVIVFFADLAEQLLTR